MANEGNRLAELYSRAREGDRDALQELCKTLEKYVRGYFWQKFRNRTIVDDLSQETYLRLLNSLLLLRDPCKLKSFVAKVAVHVSQDYFREKYRNIEDNLDIYNKEEEFEPQVRVKAEVRQQDESILDRVDLEEALSELPEKAREILVLKSQGYNYDEIAADLKLTVSDVKMQVKRSLNTLRSVLFLIFL